MQQDLDEHDPLEVRKRLIDKISTASITDTKLIMDLLQKVTQHEEQESKQMSLNNFVQRSKRGTGKSEVGLHPMTLNSGVKKHHQGIHEVSVKPQRNLFSFFPVKEEASKNATMFMEQEWSTCQMTNFMNMLNGQDPQSLSNQDKIQFESDRPANNPAQDKVYLSIWDNYYFLQGYQFPKNELVKPLKTNPLTEFQGVVYDMDSDEEYADLCAIDLNYGNDSEDSDDTDNEEGNSNFLVDDGYLSNDQQDSRSGQEIQRLWILKVDKWDFNLYSDPKEMRSQCKIISLCGQMLDVDKPVDLCLMFPTRVDQIKEYLKVSDDNLKSLQAKVTQNLMDKFQVSGWVVKKFLSRCCNKRRTNKSYSFKIKTNNQALLKPSGISVDSDQSLYGFQDSRPFSMTNQVQRRQEPTDDRKVLTPKGQ